MLPSRPRALLLVTALLVTSLPLAAPAAPAAPRCTLQARRLELGPRRGRVVDGCLRGSGGRALLRAGELRWSAGGYRGWRVRAALCPCAGEPTLSLSAQRAWVAPQGRRLHLVAPVLRWGPVPLAVLPYLALPLSPGVSGLLPPELSYSPRDGARLGQGLYLAARQADAALTAGWVQGRGVHGRALLHYALERHGAGTLELSGLKDVGRWRGAVTGRLLLRGTAWAVGATPELLADPSFFRDLHRDPGLVFAPFVRSRLWGSAHAGPLLVAADLDLYQPARVLEAGADAWAGTWRWAVSADLVALPLGPLLLFGSAGVELLGAADGAPRDRAGLGFWVAPRASLARLLGPLSLALSLGYHLRGVAVGSGDPARSTREPRGEQAVLGAVELGLPLQRRFAANLEHRLVPFVGVQGAAGEPLRGAFFSRQPTIELGVIEAGLRSTLASTGSGARSLAELTVRGLYEVREGRPLLAAEGRWQAGRHVDLALRVLGDLRAARLSWLESRACVAAGTQALRLCGGYLRQHATQLWPLLLEGSSSTGSAPMATPLSSAWVEQVEVGATLALGPVVAEGAVFVDSARGVLTHAAYALRWRSRCRCLELALLGQSFVGHRLPELALRLSWRPGSLGSCLERFAPRAVGTPTGESRAKGESERSERPFVR